MSNYKDFRIGNPVIVSGKGTIITRIPKDDVGGLNGYHVVSDAFEHEIQGLQPAPIDDHFLKVHESYRSPEDHDVYSFKGNGNVVEYFTLNNACVINGIPYGIVNDLHELLNIIEDVCGIKMLLYYPKDDDQQKQVME